MNRILVGVVIAGGAIFSGILRYSGLIAPQSDTPYSVGSNRGFWIGTAIALIVSGANIVQGIQAKREGTTAEEMSSPGNMKLSPLGIVVVVIVVVALGGLATMLGER